MFSKILIANRGEIAVRIIRACKEMGIASVAVYSEADRDCLHVALADECVCIGPASPKDSYLCQERILSAALLTGAQAIHPGYGFLSENAEFAAACRKNGIAFIGPDAECMARLSDKTSTKEAFAKTALRPIPGTGVLSSAEQAAKEAESIGYPVMLKACMGGGGRGIRLVESPAQMEAAFLSAQRPILWPWPRVKPPSATEPFILKNTSIPRATSRCRSSPTRKAMSSASASATAPSSAATRSCSRNPLPLRSTARRAQRSLPPWRTPSEPSAIRARARLNSCATRTGTSGSWR